MMGHRECADKVASRFQLACGIGEKVLDRFLYVKTLFRAANRLFPRLPYQFLEAVLDYKLASNDIELGTILHHIYKILCSGCLAGH